MGDGGVKRFKLGSYRHYSESFSDQYRDVPELIEDAKGTWIKLADYQVALRQGEKGAGEKVTSTYELASNIASEGWTVAEIESQLTLFMRQVERKTRAADCKAVNGLTGKDSGNWNRAIIYAVAAIRQQAKEGA